MHLKRHIAPYKQYLQYKCNSYKRTERHTRTNAELDTVTLSLKVFAHMQNQSQIIILNFVYIFYVN